MLEVLVYEKKFMKIIIPMAGKGLRLLPHTLTTPKPLIPIAGKPIVERLAGDINKAVNYNIKKITFIIREYDKNTEIMLLKIAKNLNIKIKIYKQKQPLGTAHAILSAKKELYGPIIIAFSDTLFQGTFNLNTNSDGIIWTKKVNNPNLYGVAKCNKKGYITNFFEKPKQFISNLAIIGIYFIKNGEKLKQEFQYLINQNNNIGEYQLTQALENMKINGSTFVHQNVKEWMDCGDKKNILTTNSKILDIEKKQGKNILIHPKAIIQNSIIIEPCFIDEKVIIINSKIGPYVSIGRNSFIKNSNIECSLIQEYNKIMSANLNNSIIGNHTRYFGISKKINLGDYSIV